MVPMDAKALMPTPVAMEATRILHRADMLHLATVALSVATVTVDLTRLRRPHQEDLMEHLPMIW